jgi:hypothetical protein
MARRVEADLAALCHIKYDAEVIFPSGSSITSHNLSAHLALTTYPNISGQKFFLKKYGYYLICVRRCLIPSLDWLCKSDITDIL